MRTIPFLARSLAIGVLALSPLLASAASNDAALAHAVSDEASPDAPLLSPEQAFSAVASQSGPDITVNYTVAPGYYLYRNHMSFETSTPDAVTEAQFTPGEVKDDCMFGRQVVYKHSAIAKLKVKDTAPASFTLQVHYQGCAAVGVCYPPQTRQLQVNGPAIFAKGAGNMGDHTGTRNLVVQPGEERCVNRVNERKC